MKQPRARTRIKGTRSRAPKSTLLGAHMSISGGLERAILMAQDLGCNCLQLFTHSNRQWNVAPISQEQIVAFEAARKKTGITAVVAHASYLVNLASSKKHVRLLSQKTVIQELERCEALKIPYLVLHPGALVGQTPEEGITHVVAALNEALQQVPGKSMLLLEIMAGQGSVLGSTLEELAAIRKRISHKKRVGFCFDTCHAFAAGYDFTTPQSYKEFWLRFDTVLGLEHLKVIHLNDSKGKLGSHLDRHANIGKGELGLEAFRLLMNDARFTATPKILETPYEVAQDYERDLGVLRGLVGREKANK